MVRVAMNVTQIITAFGGYQKAGMILGVSRSLLARWEEEGLPAKRWSQLAALSETHASRCFTVEELARVQPSKTPSEAA